MRQRKPWENEVEYLNALRREAVVRSLDGPDARLVSKIYTHAMFECEEQARQRGARGSDVTRCHEILILSRAWRHSFDSIQAVALAQAVA